MLVVFVSPVKHDGFRNMASGSSSIRGGILKPQQSSGEASAVPSSSGESEGDKPASASSAKDSKNVPKWLKIGML